jgi:predicted adenylyl cyclase CyaB
MSEYLEIETKYDATDIKRVDFKVLAENLGQSQFRYAESRDLYYVKSEEEFLRHRTPSSTDATGKSELTFKKKHADGNNLVRTEVNLRVDHTPLHTVKTFCEGLGYKFNFSILKYCDIYVYDDANIAYYTVLDENRKSASFIEVEANEYLNGVLFANGSPIRISQEQGWAIVQKYEKLLSPLGITAQKRMKLSLFERYRKAPING